MERPSQEELLRAALKHQDALTCYAYGLLRDWALAQDAVQEALIVVHQKWETFEAGGNVFAWVRQIVKGKAVDAIRARKRQRLPGDEELFALVDRQFEQHLQGATLERMEHLQRVLPRCLGRLREEARLVLLGFYRDMLSCEQLAARLSKSSNAVRLILSRTRESLRECATRELRVEGS